MRLHTLVAIAVTMCAIPALAADPPVAPVPQPVPLRVTKVFSVSTLVNAADPRQGERLTRLLVSIVRPYSWEARGGTGTIEYHKTESSLVVTNTADVLKEFGDLLESFNRIQSGAAQLPPTDWMVRDLRAVQNPPPVAPAPRPAKSTTAFKLRNVAASDVATALAKHFAGKANEPRITFDAPTNTVFLSAEPEAVKAATGIVAALDRPSPQVVVRGVVLVVPEEFIKTSGLTIGTEPSPDGAAVFVLSARETHMLDQLLRAEKANDKGNIDILSRPQLQVADNQTGVAQVGNGEGDITFRATPRVMPDGRVLLRAEIQAKKPGAPVFTPTGILPSTRMSTVQTTAELKAGETLVARVDDALVIVTPTIVK